MTGPLRLGTVVLLAASLAPVIQSVDPGEHRCLAMTLYWEARAEGREGMLAVAWVILNRRNHPDFPDDLCGVVREGGEQAGCQFSYWCDGRADTPPDTETWRLARVVAEEFLTAQPPDPTGGALFYHTAGLPEVPWKVYREPTARIGDHVYYR